MFLTARAGSLQSDAQCGCGIESGTRTRFQRVARLAEHCITPVSSACDVGCSRSGARSHFCCESINCSHLALRRRLGSHANTARFWCSAAAQLRAEELPWT